MEFSLSKTGQLRPKQLDNRQFTLSLLREAMTLGLVESDRVGQIQLRLMELLSEVILKYTHRESSSVKTETGESLLLSVLYSVDFYLRTLPSPEEALQQLLLTDSFQLYQKGLTLLQAEVELAKQVLKDVRASRTLLPLTAYNLTIDAGMDEFFLNYDIRFEAHNTLISIDYPLLGDDMSQTGIVYIKHYLEHLLLENELCSHFPPDYLDKLLKGYGQKYHLQPADLLVNVPELILKNAICSVLAGQPPDTLTIHEEDCQQLTRQLDGYTPREYSEILSKALDSLFRQLTITSQTVQGYCKPLLRSFSHELHKAVQDDTLFRLIVLESDTWPESKVIYHPKPQLSNAQLRLVIAELKECQDANRKADLIQGEIHNLEDLTEVLNSWCIFPDEYLEIFRRLGDFELAYLVRLTGEDVLQEQPEESWQLQLQDYLGTIAFQRCRNIRELASKLQ